MSSDYSDSTTLSFYRLYFDDIEEIFFNTISFKYLFISTVIAFVLTIFSIIILVYRSKTMFYACLIPFVYSLIFYDLVQLFSMILLRYNLLTIHKRYFGEFCRWPYYLKASSEGGECLTLAFIYAIRCQKVRRFLKHNCVPNFSRVHSRALTCVCLLVIVYVNNWITHLKVEKVHLVTLNEANHEINIQEYPTALYGANQVKLDDYSRYYSDLDKYARHYQKARRTHTRPEKIIHTQKDDSIQQILIKFPYPDLFGKQKSSVINQTRRKLPKFRRKLNKSLSQNSSYRVCRCTFGQRNFFLTSCISLAYCIFYLILIIYHLTTIYRYRIPNMSIEYHRSSYEAAFALEQSKCAERHRQLVLLSHLRYFQYSLICGHTILIIIRLVYICSLTILLCLVPSPFKWLAIRTIFYAVFCLVYYSVPLRLILLFFYLVYSLFSSYIHSIFCYLFRTKLHFSCQLRRPTIRFRLHLVPYEKDTHNLDEQAKNSFVMDLTSSGYEERSTSFPNESMAIGEDNSSIPNVVTTSHFVVVNEVEQSQL